MRRLILDVDDDTQMLNITLVRTWERDDDKIVTDMRSHGVILDQVSHTTFDGEKWEDEKLEDEE